jgi:hypothetical protein
LAAWSHPSLQVSARAYSWAATNAAHPWAATKTSIDDLSQWERAHRTHITFPSPLVEKISREFGFIICLAAVKAILDRPLI